MTIQVINVSPKISLSVPASNSIAVSNVHSTIAVSAPPLNAISFDVVGAPGQPGPPGPAGDATGLPVGGTANQVLVKQSSTDFDAIWSDPVGGTGAVDSVNGKTGIVVLNYTDVGADQSGAATTAVTNHIGQADPHAQYQKESERAAANGYASLDVGTKVPIAQVPTGTTGTTVALGNHTHTGVYDPAGSATTAQTNANSYTDTQISGLATVASTGAYTDLSGRPTLGTAADNAETDFATAAQGVLADTAIQSADLATVATTGNYTDLSGKPTLGSAAASNIGDFDPAGSAATAEANANTYTDTSSAARLRWAGWYTENGVYAQNDVVRDGDYLMVSLIDGNNDPAAPTPTDSPAWEIDLPAQPSWTTISGVTSSEIVNGARFIAQEELLLTKYRFWAAAGNVYSFYRVDDPGGPGENFFAILMNYTLPVGEADGWQEFGVGNEILMPTQTFDLFQTIRDDSATTGHLVANWNYVTPNNPTVPLAGQISHADKLQSVLSVSKTDSDAVDRSASLALTMPGDLIDMGPDSWTILGITDRGTYVDFQIAPDAQTDAVDGTYSFDFVQYQASTMSYRQSTDYLLGRTDIRGLYTDTGGYNNITINDNAYGIDILTQPVEFSVNWEELAHSGGGGSSAAPVDSVNGQTGAVTLDYTDVGAASAAQGTLADTAIQSGDLATVATTGAYSDLTGQPTLGTAAASNIGDFATSAQGSKADTAVQNVQGVTGIWAGTQAAWDLLTPNPTTFYVIVG